MLGPAIMSLSLSLLFLWGCTPKSAEPILFGQDSCAHCKMMITDRRFGGEIITTKGKVYKFDSLECLNDFSKKNRALLGESYREFVVSVTNQGALIPANSARFYLEPTLRSPMGKGYLAAPSVDALRSSLGQDKIDKTLTWEDVKREIEK